MIKKGQAQLSSIGAKQDEFKKIEKVVGLNILDQVCFVEVQL